MFRILLLRRYRIYIRSRHAPTLGGKIRALSGMRLPQRSWIIVEERSKGIFKVVKNNLTDSDHSSLGISGCSSEVRILEDPSSPSDEFQCFGMPSRVRWEDVWIEPYEFHASSLSRLKEALSHITFCAWCVDDI